MGFIDAIKTAIESGYVSLGGVITFGIGVIILLIKNNGLAKNLFESKTTITDFKNTITELKTELNTANEYIKNSNEIVSAIIDFIHIAYSASNLDVAAKLQLQKIYDKCPDALADAKDKLLLTLEEEATEEQVEVAKANDTEVAVNTIIDKLK